MPVFWSDEGEGRRDDINDELPAAFHVGGTAVDGFAHTDSLDQPAPTSIRPMGWDDVPDKRQSDEQGNGPAEICPDHAPAHFGSRRHYFRREPTSCQWKAGEDGHGEA